MEAADASGICGSASPVSIISVTTLAESPAKGAPAMMATPTRTLRRSLSPEAVMAEDAETKPVHTRIEDGPPYWSSVATPSPPPRRPSFAKQCPTMPTPLQDGPPYWSSLYNVLSPSPTPETPPSTRSGKLHHQGSEASATHETPMTPPLLKHQKRVVPQGEESGA